jgi:hypothetical protein
MRTRAAATWLMTGALVIGACGCAASSPASSPAKPGSQRSPRPTAAATGMQMSRDMPMTRLSPTRQAVQLRVGLEELFGEDAFAGIRVIRSRLRDGADFTQAAVSALSRNSDDLTMLLGRVYGSARVAEFGRLWESQEEGLVAYARAASQHGQAAKVAKAAARRQLMAFPGRIAQNLRGLTSGKVTAAAIRSQLRTHINDLTRFADAYAARHYASAYRIEQVDYQHQFALGTLIAARIAGGRAKKLPADFNSPLTRLQSTLGELLGEHMQLVVDAMGAALRGGPEFRADAAQVNGNTTELAGAFGVLFGPPSGAAFTRVWGEHVDALVSYSGAIATKNRKAEAKARAQLRAFEHHLSRFLATSTDGRLTAPALAGVLHMHDSELVEQLNAYARGNYAAAYRIAYQGYLHMFAVAQALSDAIGPTIAARLPKGGAQTGGGGMARYR